MLLAGGAVWRRVALRSYEQGTLSDTRRAAAETAAAHLPLTMPKSLFLGLKGAAAAAPAAAASARRRSDGAILFLEGRLQWPSGCGRCLRGLMSHIT